MATDYETLMGDFDHVKAADPDQAALYYARLTSEFKEKNPGASAKELDEAYAAIGQNISSEVRGKGAFGSPANDPNSQQTAQARSSFESAVTKARARSFEADTLEQKHMENQANTEFLLGELPKLLNTIDMDPSNAKGIQDTFLKMAAERGADEKQVRSLQGEMAATHASALIGQDPANALAYMEANPEEFGTNIVRFKNQAKQAQSRMEAAQAKDRVQETAQELPFNLEKLREAQKSKDPVVREAAIDKERKIKKNPVQAAIAEGTVSNFVADFLDSGELLQREDDLEVASEEMGENIPFLDNTKEVSRLTERLKDPQYALDFLKSSAELGDASRGALADQLKGDPIGWALRLGPGHDELQKKIVQGMNTPLKPGQSEPKFAFDSPPYVSAEAEGQNKQAANAIKALIRGGMDEDEARKEVLNEREVGGFLWFDGKKMVVPGKFTGEEMERTSNALFADPKLLKKYSNGDPAKAKTLSGEPVEFDSDDVELVPLAYGVYGVMIDGLPLVTSDGETRFQIDMEGALNGR